MCVCLRTVLSRVQVVSSHRLRDGRYRPSLRQTWKTKNSMCFTKTFIFQVNRTGAPELVRYDELYNFVPRPQIPCRAVSIDTHQYLRRTRSSRRCRVGKGCASMCASPAKAPPALSRALWLAQVHVRAPRCAFVKMRAGDSPRRAVACSRVACRPDPPQGPARGRLGREHPVRRNPAALLRPLATGAPPHMWPPGRELWCAALSCAWCERRVTGRTLSRARRAQVQLAATRIALHTHEWRSARTRSSSPDVKRGAPCGGTAFVALRCCARGAGRRRRGHGGRCLHVLAA